ncbi:hypothetical protein evm_015582, partial [Chilo suppressalis]
KLCIYLKIIIANIRIKMESEMDSCSENETCHVTTLISLKKRRERLLEIKKQILLKQTTSRENTTQLVENVPTTCFAEAENHNENPDGSDLSNSDTITFNSAELLKFGDPDVSEPVISATNNVVSVSYEMNDCIDALNRSSILDFSSDDSVADPNYTPLSEISNVAPIVSSSTDINNNLIPESHLEHKAAAESRIRKRKADKVSSKRFRNKRSGIHRFQEDRS